MTASRPIRIGNDEREAAQKALDVHMTAGRLDPEEFGDRFARAGVAQTRADLDVLFTDLPEPHARPAAEMSRPATVSPPPATSQALGGRFGTTIVAASPFIALILFFVFHSWLFFLLIPLAGAIVYGGERGRDRSRTRRR